MDERAIERAAIAEIVKETKEAEQRNKPVEYGSCINKRLLSQHLVSTLRNPVFPTCIRKRRVIGLDDDSEDESETEKKRRKCLDNKERFADGEYIYDAREYFNPEKYREIIAYRHMKRQKSEHGKRRHKKSHRSSSHSIRDFKENGSDEQFQSIRSYDDDDCETDIGFENEETEQLNMRRSHSYIAEDGDIDSEMKKHHKSDKRGNKRRHKKKSKKHKKDISENKHAKRDKKHAKHKKHKIDRKNGVKHKSKRKSRKHHKSSYSEDKEADVYYNRTGGDWNQFRKICSKDNNTYDKCHRSSDRSQTASPKSYLSNHVSQFSPQDSLLHDPRSVVNELTEDEHGTDVWSEVSGEYSNDCSDLNSEFKYSSCEARNYTCTNSLCDKHSTSS